MFHIQKNLIKQLAQTFENLCQLFIIIVFKLMIALFYF